MRENAVVLFEKRGAAFWITINRPDKRNALNKEVSAAIGLLCMVDLAVAADHAQFGLPEVKAGVFPMQVLSLLQHLAPRRWVREWCVSGEPFSAAAEKDAGLLNHVVPAGELDAKVEWLVQRIAGRRLFGLDNRSFMTNYNRRGGFRCGSRRGRIAGIRFHRN